MNSKYLTRTILAGALALGAAESSAIPIGGSVLFSGTADVLTGGGVTTVTPNNPWSVISSTGDFAIEGLAPGSLAGIGNIAYTGTGSGATLVAPVTPEWIVVDAGGTTYSFDLLALTSATFTPGPNNSIAMSGTGTAHISGPSINGPYEDTPATWAFEATGNNISFVVASESTTASGQIPGSGGEDVPDGGATAFLLGFGLLGIGAAARK